MRLIRADHRRRVELAGVAKPVPRPVDIDRLQTGFRRLRSLRIYRFAADSAIDGHAEEDEVLIVVMAGCIEITLIDDLAEGGGPPAILSQAGEAPGGLCAAYLPPNGAYHLRARTEADVAYMRATPLNGPPAAAFDSQANADGPGIHVLWSQASYPRLLRARLLQIKAEHEQISFRPLEEAEDGAEGLIHVTTVPEQGYVTVTSADREPLSLVSWDSVSVEPGDRPVVHVAAGCSAIVLIVLAG